VDTTPTRRYAAFISYSHTDRKWARWLHRALEGYRIPKKLRVAAAASERPVERLAPVFLDREELSTTSDLAESIRTALHQSQFLIVVCSPKAAQSRWVDEEVRSFKALGRATKILCLIVAGEPGAVERGLRAELECFPPSLRFQTDELQPADAHVPEPLAADVRRGADTRHAALLKIVAGMLGASLDDIRQRDQARRHRRLVFTSTAATIGCFVLASLSLVAWRARNEAENQRALAVQKSLTAERTSKFIVSLFAVADPSEARGNSITAREVLDRGVRQIDESLRDEPQTRAELLRTLGDVYQGLGLYEPSLELLTKARSIPAQRPIEWIRETTSLADLELQRGNASRTEQLFKEAELRLRNAGITDPAIEAHILLGRGGAAAKLDRTDEAIQLLQRAMEISKRYDLEDITVQALEEIAMTTFYSGDLKNAEEAYGRALNARIAVSGETHPKAAESINGLAATAYMRGDNQHAEAYWIKLVDVETRLLGPRHPELAATLNNLGRVRLERRDFDKALDVLNKAVAIKSEQQSANDADMAFALSNLALAHIGQRDYAPAEPLLERALSVAVTNDQALQGPIMVYLADTYCHTKRIRKGLQRLEDARPKIAARYPDDAWRLALLENVQANCLTGQSQYREAGRLIIASTPVVLQKWRASSLFGHQALANGIRLFQLTGDTVKLEEYRQRIEQP
jgi:tetratricopeptide (TPR) repeat protein